MDESISLSLWVAIVSGAVVLAVLTVAWSFVGWHRRRTIRQVQELSARVLSAQEAERASLAAELHDDVVPRLWGTQLQLDGAPEGARERLDELTADLRTLAHRLRDAKVPGGDLPRAIGDLAVLAFGETVELRLQPVSGLPDAAMVALYRVTQEAFTNIRKHVGSTTVLVELQDIGDAVELRVTDRGGGSVSHGSYEEGFGLRSMRERMAAVGGSLTIGDASEATGTTVAARVPRS